MTSLLDCSDSHFAWMLGGEALDPDLSLPPGGVEDRATLRILKEMAANVRAVHAAGAWMIVADGEIVGLAGYKAPAKDGVVEIGYGVAACRRRRGHATRAVAAMLAFIERDPLVRSVVAETAIHNIPSQSTLAANGFFKSGTRHDAEEGELIVWRHGLSGS